MTDVERERRAKQEIAAVSMALVRRKGGCPHHDSVGDQS